MDAIFLIIIFIILVIILFIGFRIAFKTTVWSSLVAALWWGLLLTLAIQVVMPSLWLNNTSSVQGMIIIIAIVLIITTIYITDRMLKDKDEYAISCTDRNVVFW